MIKQKIDFCLSTQECIFYFKKELSSVNFINSFFDLRDSPSDYSLSNLIRIGKENSKNVFENEKMSFISLLNKKFEVFFTETILEFNKVEFRKGSTVFFLIAHFTVADISSLSDFDLIKEKLKIINKTFVTIGRPIIFDKVSLHIRDSSLLSVSGSSLKEIGKLYTTMEKKEIGENIKEMDVFMDSNYKDFREYAIQDSVLALFHTLKVEETVIIELKKMFIPVSLASFSGSFLQSKLDITKYKLPLNPVFQSSLQEVFTPIGVESNPFSLHLPLFLGSLHGGRNESYVYGLCLGEFIDYDLPGAYPTAMSLLGYPDYTKLEIFLNLSGEELLKSSRDLLKSYTVLKVKFQFPKTCLYPNLPVRLEKSSIIYPLTGEGICTGSEFLLAMDLNCSIEIEQGVYIPFLKEDDVEIKECENAQSIQRQPNQSLCYEELDYVQLQAVEGTQIDHVPYENMLKQTYKKFENFEITDFYKLVKSLIDERKKYPSKSYNNLLYKLIANSGIGQMSRGLSRKKSYNPLLKTTTIIPSGSLTNPLFASWITSYIRTVLSEILNYISNLDSEKIIISSTTDGFICNVVDLNKYDFGRFSSLYRYARERLGFEDILLEVKHTEPIGLLS